MTHEVVQIGLVVIFGVVLVPVYLMFAGWFIGRPRDFRTVFVTIGYMLGFTALIVVGLAITGTAISLVMPT